MLVSNPFDEDVWAPTIPGTAPPVVLFLPARDEAATVAAVLARTPATVTAAGRTHPVHTLVVDDGSSDGTGDVARAAGATVVRTPGIGLGGAVRVGLAWAAACGAAAVAFCDADLEYDPAELPRLVEPVLEGRADYVVGSRFLGGRRRMRPHRLLGNRVLTALTAAATVGCRAVPLTDGQSGYRALSGAAAADADIAHDYNYAQILTLDLLRRGHRYLEVPIDYAHREVGRSFVHLPTYLRQVLPAMWRVRRGPVA
ncbi:MAG TPA: glycosyltransferase family 2 protein [Acidimicrobiales bacterium]|nr:glycosyltransferase family 2 protein [Acidimicrobiales bacterium]